MACESNGVAGAEAAAPSCGPGALAGGVALDDPGATDEDDEADGVEGVETSDGTVSTGVGRTIERPPCAPEPAAPGDEATAVRDGDSAADVEFETRIAVPATAPPVATDTVTAIAASAP